jgi:trehalose 6-phosphate phosphatase
LSQEVPNPDGVDALAPLAIFLDFDGTLVDLAATPSLTSAPPGLASLLQDLSRKLDGALAIITGRSLADIDRMLEPARLCAAGVHGAEMRDETGGAVLQRAAPLEETFVEQVRQLENLAPGILVEPKSVGIAVHYRLAEDKGPEVVRLLEELLPEAGEPLDLRPGKMVAEAIPRAASKGAALREFMQKPPFAGRLPIMIGDDSGDLSAFEAAETLGGKGLRVAGEYFAATSADFSGTAEVRRWLAAMVEKSMAKQADRE